MLLGTPISLLLLRKMYLCYIRICGALKKLEKEDKRNRFILETMKQENLQAKSKGGQSHMHARHLGIYWNGKKKERKKKKRQGNFLDRIANG